jgi:secreted trypsin-like serine protease
MQIKRAWAVIGVLVCSVSTIAIADGGDDASGVVGGRPVAAGDWPDAVAVLGNDGMCSGTLIAPDVVLTAGHCLDIDPVGVVIDSVDLDRPDDGEWIVIDRGYTYPGWETSYDVAVLVLARASRTPPRPVAQLCTARGELRRGAELTVVGFGRTTADDDGDQNVKKHAAAITVIDHRCTTDASCQITGGEFIAGGHGADACFGDSGGGAYAPTAHGWAVLGVVSRGLAGDWQCGNGGVYVRADRVASWIEDVTGREIARAECDAASDDPGAFDDEAGGCSAGRRAGAGVMMLLVLAALIRGRVTSGPRRARPRWSGSAGSHARR